ncbi:flagellar biosynthetic protein FliR [Mucisphaera sp.]|uniref:flagellar biosynthetic protein FliR n=1 Tax=Mucisphaera sp. TaxID=2913024 RepID=UPI003D1328C3
MVDLSWLLPHTPAFLLVLSRMTGLFLFAPMFGSNAIPRFIRVLFAFSLSLAIYPMLLEPTRDASGFLAPLFEHGLILWTLLPLMAVELLIGFVIGWCASLPLIGVQMAGHTMDQQMGLGLAQVLNPELGEQSGVLGEFLFVLALALFLLMGGHLILISTLIASFDNFPPGGFTGFQAIFELAVAGVTLITEMTIRVAAPLLALIFLETIAMGFVARTVPQMNILSIGFALRIVVGLAFIVLITSTIAAVYQDTMKDMLKMIMSLIAFQPDQVITP